MLSSNKNDEAIGRLAQLLKEYAALGGEYVKLELTERLGKLLGAIVFFVILFLLGLGVFFYLSIAAVYLIDSYINCLAGSFAIVAAIDLLVILFVAAVKKPLIVNPIVRTLAKIILKK